MWSQVAQELTAGPRVVHLEHDVRAAVGLWAVAQRRRLNVVQLDGDTSAGKIAADAVDDGHGAFPAELVADLVKELVDGLADALQPSRLRDRQVIGDVPAFRGDLMLGEVVLRMRAADPRPTFPRPSR